MFRISPILLIIFCFQLNTLMAQNSWYENSSDVHNLIYEEDIEGTFTNNQANPIIDGLNTNPIVSKFVRDGQGDAFVSFRFPNPITDLSDLSISLKAYISMETSELTSDNDKLRIELRNSVLGGDGSIYEEVEFSTGETWESFSFDFDDCHFYYWYKLLLNLLVLVDILLIYLSEI